MICTIKLMLPGWGRIMCMISYMFPSLGMYYADPTQIRILMIQIVMCAACEMLGVCLTLHPNLDPDHQGIFSGKFLGK